jgi:hypothetical protein
LTAIGRLLIYDERKPMEALHVPQELLVRRGVEQ